MPKTFALFTLLFLSLPVAEAQASWLQLTAPSEWLVKASTSFLAKQCQPNAEEQKLLRLMKR